MSGYIRVTNNTSDVVYVFISNYNGGDDNWFKLDPGASDNWGRGEGTGGGWEVVAFRNTRDSQRAGVYVKINTHVTFKDFDDIVVN